MNRIIIDGDQARLYGVPKAIPTGQVGFSKIGFEFSPEWDGMTKIAQFMQGENKYNVAVENNECTCPNELVKGWVSVRVRGYSETTVIATANEILLPVSTGFQSGGIPPIPPAPDLYQQFLKVIQDQIGDLADLTTEAKDTLVAAINEVESMGGRMALRVADGYIQYSTDSGSTWQNLIALADLKGAGMDITGATIGQIAKITAVDDSGKPTAWEPVDMPSGGGSVQPDWNQNDDTQPDYVKNRPFYTGDPVETVLVEESTVPFEDDGDMYMGQLESTFSATVGETYKVSWDGTTYECACVDFSGMTVIGNLSIGGAGSDTGEPFVMSVENGQRIGIYTADTASSHTISISRFTQEVVKIDRKYLPPQSKPVFKPEGKSYLTFRSPNEFTLSLRYGEKGWNGTLEYFASNETWTTWSGRNALSAVANGGEYVLYLRGIGNSGIGGKECGWNLDGTDIKCIGNIENLLDYATVESGNHPIMRNKCYNNMFGACTSLTQAPALPATTLADNCYYGMFSGCTGLKLSSIRTDKYVQEYRIPSSGNGVTANAALENMFTNTGGTFTGTPSINTTYYLSSDNMVIRETELATLNGYVGSVVDAAIENHECIIPSSTVGSTKKFKITVDDSGAISATEVTK